MQISTGLFLLALVALALIAGLLGIGYALVAVVGWVLGALTLAGAQVEMREKEKRG